MGRKGKRRTLAPGIRRDPGFTGIYDEGKSYRVVASGGRGKQEKTWFPKCTPLSVMQAWRADKAAKLRTEKKQRANRGTFEGDARRYLRTVAAMPDIDGRTLHIEEWIALFGTRRRDSITSAEIRARRDKLMTEPYRVDVDPDTGERTEYFYAASSINHRLRALSNLFTVLDGVNAENPVREVPEVDEPARQAKGLDYAAIEAILAQMPDRGSVRTPRPKGFKRKKGARPRPDVSITKAWVRAQAYCGLEHSDLEQIQPEDVNWDAGTIPPRRRNKGAGVEGEELPLLPEGKAALWKLVELGVLGKPRSKSSVWKSFNRAAKKAGYPQANLKTLRHSFGTLIYEVTGDIKMVQKFLRQSTTKMAEFYALAAQRKVLGAAANKIADHLKSRKTFSENIDRKQAESGGNKRSDVFRPGVPDTRENSENTPIH